MFLASVLTVLIYLSEHVAECFFSNSYENFFDYLDFIEFCVLGCIVSSAVASFHRVLFTNTVMPLVCSKGHYMKSCFF